MIIVIPASLLTFLGVYVVIRLVGLDGIWMLVKAIGWVVAFPFLMVLYLAWSIVEVFFLWGWRLLALFHIIRKPIKGVDYQEVRQ